MKLNCPPILFGEVWDLVSCDIISCIHVLCVWIGLSLVVKFRNCLILTQLPVFSDSSLLSSPFPDSYRIVLCPVNSHKCVGCMLINFSVYLKWIKHVSSEKHFLLSKTGFPWGVWRGPASAELFELMGMWREAPRSARPPPSCTSIWPPGCSCQRGRLDLMTSCLSAARSVTNPELRYFAFLWFFSDLWLQEDDEQ